MASSANVSQTRTLASTRQHNLVAVMRAIMEAQQVSRTEIAKETGFSKATVSRMVDDLIAKGLVKEGDEVRGEGPGRSSTTLVLTERTGCVIGIDLGLTNCRLGCCDLQGNVLGESRFTTPASSTIDDLAYSVVGAVKTLAGTTPYADKVETVVIAVTSRVARGSTLLDSLFDAGECKGDDIGDGLFSIISKNLNANVIIDTDSNMALVNELFDGEASEADSAALITISTKISAAVALERKLLRGGRWLVGDIGKLDVHGVGGRDSMSMGEFLSARTFCDIAKQEGITSTDIQTIVDEISNYPSLETYRQEFIYAVSSLIEMLCVTIDPDVVIFTGRMRPLLQVSVAEIEERLHRKYHVLPRICLVGSERQSSCRGASLLATEVARRKLLASLDEI